VITHLIFFQKKQNNCIIIFNKNGWLVAQLHESLTLSAVCRNPTHCLRRFQRSDCGYKGVSLSHLYVFARKLPHLLCHLILFALSELRSWRISSLAQYKWNVSVLLYAAKSLSDLRSLSRNSCHMAGKL
jgi:hypothetical protein